MEYIDLLTQVFGYIAVVLLFVSFQIDNRKSILGFLIVGMVFLATHQFLLGAFAGAFANGLTIFRNVIFRQKNDSPILQHFAWPYVFSLVLIVSVSVF